MKAVDAPSLPENSQYYSTNYFLSGNVCSQNCSFMHQCSRISDFHQKDFLNLVLNFLKFVSFKISFLFSVKKRIAELDTISQNELNQ